MGDRAASVQFDGDRGITVRILEVDKRPTLPGWAWLTVAVLGPPAARRRAPVRSVFVRPAGLRPAPVAEPEGPDERPEWERSPSHPDLLRVPEGGGVAAAERADPVPELIR